MTPAPRSKGLKKPTPAKLAALNLKPIVVPHPQSQGWVGHPLVAHIISSALSSGHDLGGSTPRTNVINGRSGALDQGPTSSCTWHSFSAGLYTACRAQGRPLPFLPSMDLGYKVTRALERAQLSPAPLYDLEDTGAEVPDVIRIGAEYGVAPFGKPALDGRYSDIDPAWVNEEPNAGRLQEAGLSIVTGPYAIDPTSPTVSDVAAACIEAGMPIDVGFYCDMAFETAASSVVRTAPVVANLQGEGGHSVYLSAFRTNVFSKREFRVENSWGDGWCDGGTCWVDELWLAACWNLMPLVIQYVGPRTDFTGFARAAKSQEMSANWGSPSWPSG
jgi:hypothetical protein